MQTGKVTFSTQPDEGKLTRIAEELTLRLGTSEKRAVYVAGGFFSTPSINVLNPIGDVLYRMPVDSEGIQSGARQYYFVIPLEVRSMLKWDGLGAYFASQGAIEYPSSAVGGYRRKHKGRRRTLKGKKNRKGRKTRR
jgi:hypothetical protein